jgi:hypothetical protein
MAYMGQKYQKANKPSCFMDELRLRVFRVKSDHEPIRDDPRPPLIASNKR